MSQQSIRHGGFEEQEPPADPALPAPAAAVSARDEQLDSLLDEIDDVLAINAEEFVKGFVQKGGQ